MIPYVVVAYIVVFTCLLLTRIGFGYSCQGSLLLIALFTLAHIVVMASFGLLISNFSENTQQAMCRTRKPIDVKDIETFSRDFV